MTYAYDQASHLIGVGDTSAAMTAPAASASYAANYAYDPLNRPLTVSWSPAPAQTTPTASTSSFAFGYDTTNRRISQTATDNSWWSYPTTATNVSYTANNLNQYTAVGSVTPTYDGNGNLTYDGTFTYGYDAENRLISASGSGLTASYAYDAQGRRKSKAVNGTTTIYVTDADNREILEYDGSSGAIENWYAYALGSNDVLNKMNVASATRSTFIPDILGSFIGTLDASTGTLTKYGYQAYGESNSANSSFAYTGQRIDAETGLYYSRTRMYSPSWGRFPQPDVVGYAGGSNLYAYVNNDPLNLVDPNGLWGVGVVGSASVEGGLVYGGGATASVGGGVFGGGSQGLNVGGFASGGAFVGGPGLSASAPAPLPAATTGAVGAYAGAGVGGFITNATNVGELKGPFNTYSINTPVGSLQLGVSGSTWIFSVTCGVPPCGIGVGGAGSTYPTNTGVAPDVTGPTSSAQPGPTNVIPAAVVAPTPSGAAAGASYGGLGGGAQNPPPK